MKKHVLARLLSLMAVVLMQVSPRVIYAATGTEQNLLGDWRGVMTRESQDVEIELNFSRVAQISQPVRYYCPMDRQVHSGQPGKCPICGMDLIRDDTGLHGSFTSLTQSVMDYPLEQISFHAGNLHAVLGDSIILDGIVEGNSLSGKFTDNDASGTFMLHRAVARKLPYRTMNVKFSSGGVTLAGTLCMPRSAGRHPAVVLLHGSGAQSRWGTNRFLADRFARAGIVALAYDKRGSGESSGQWETATYEDLARDTIAGIDMLRSMAGVNSTWIGVLGHSEGGIVAPVTAILAPDKVAFIVAEDTVAGPVYQQDIYRTHLALAHTSFSREQIVDADRLYGIFIDAARGARPKDDLRRAIAASQMEPWLDWLGIPGDDSWIWARYPKIGNVDTLDYWRQVKIPILLVYGERDQLLPVDESLARIEGVLNPKGSYAAFIIPGAQHNLTIQPEPYGNFFWWRTAPGVTSLIVNWVSSITRKG